MKTTGVVAAGASGRVSEEHGRYRPDIDGLRAVAVLSVLLYHANLPPFTGGFVGVDVFFVISGYLITGIIYGELRRGEFSIARFYERRVRRIFPALYATITATLIGATFVFSAIDLQHLHSSVAWLGIFASNVYFMDNAGYFDAASDQNAILQTWSLAIEEQFYVVFPLALVGLHRLAPARLKWIILFVALASLAYSVAIVDRNARSAFFSTPGRIWELMTGALLVMNLLPLTASQVAREWIAAVGAAMIAGSLIVLNVDVPFPGLYAVPACLGTAAIIWANTAGSTFVGRVLSLRPMVFVGLISYSLYLLHWPILVLGRYAFKGEFGVLHALFALCIAFVAAVLSWRYIEMPFRKWRNISRRALFATAIGLMLTLVGGGVATAVWYAGQLTSTEKFTIAEQKRLEADRCLLRDTQTLKDWPAAECTYAGKGTSIVVWGDSFAGHLFGSFRQLGSKLGRPLVLVGESSCPPIANLPVPNRPGCEAFNREVMAKLLRDKPGIVVLSADWMVYEKKKTIAEVVTDKYELLTRTIEALRAAGSRVVVVGPSPIFPAPVPQIAAAERSDTVDATAKASYSRKFDDLFATLERAGKITYVRPYTMFCGSALYCRYKLGGELLFWDEGHLTARGAAIVVDRMAGDVLGTPPPHESSHQP